MANSLHSLDWSLVQSFVAVADTGSLSAAARGLGLTQPTVGRQVAAMEARLGIALFRRRPRGMEPTEAARSLLPAARAMQDAAQALSLAAAGSSEAEGGTVRLTASIFASHHILPPIIARLRREAPGVALELVPSDTTENLLFREADIAVRMYRPTQLDVVARNLGSVDLALFAARSYLDRVGRPQNRDEVLSLDFVGYDRNDEIIRGFRSAGIDVDRDFFATRCDHQTTYWELVRAGCGAGFGMARAGRADSDLQEIDLGVPIPRLEVWLTAPSAIRHSRPVARVWDTLAEALSGIVDRRP